MEFSVAFILDVIHYLNITLLCATGKIVIFLHANLTLGNFITKCKMLMD